MKNITVSVDDDLYHAARAQAAKQKKSLSGLVREFLAGLQQNTTNASKAIDPELQRLYAMSDRKHAGRQGSVGPLNREELHERSVPY